MTNQMCITDEIRVNILDALLKAKSVQPNIRQIKHHTGYHKATIKSSIDFLQKEGVLRGFGPKIDFRKLGYKLEVTRFSQLDMNERGAFEKFLEVAEKDPHVYWLGSVAGGGNWNFMSRQIYKDVESFHENIQKSYRIIPGIYSLVKNSQEFFSVEPTFKNASRTKAMVDLIKMERGWSED